MNQREEAFVRVVLDFYEANGRHTLPWRQTTDPYKIMVSEIMLQQTQVDRVVPKYDAFIKRFPTTKALARAPLGEVLRCWQGLGYNRRAKLLWEAANVIERDEAIGTCQSTCQQLRALPGIGPYTAGAIRAFACNQAVPIVETNIRTVYMFHFFKNRSGVTDAEILTKVERTLGAIEPRVWYAALMDYGAHLKRTAGNQNVRSAHYTKQAPFKGSDRHVRGAILRALSIRSHTLRSLAAHTALPHGRLTVQLAALEREGLITRRRTQYSLPA